MASDSELDVVTGAFGYTGKYVTKRLLSCGRAVRTLTNRTECDSSFGGKVRAFPLDFSRPGHLRDTLRGATTLYNTYWVRFSHRAASFDKAVDNTKTLIAAAREAGVRRIVHVSITNAAVDSPLPYFHGKGVLEKAIRESGVSYSIVRPTLVFGPEDILVNNIAWFLRTFPVFGIPGSGQYRVQPVFVEDLADIMVRVAQCEGNVTIDATGPEILTFEEMVRLIATMVQSRAKIVRLPPWLALFATRLCSLVLRDVVLTKEELEGLMASLLLSNESPEGTTRLTDWLTENGAELGTTYSSELKRHYR